MISLKAVLLFLKNFLEFRLETTEKQGIINLSRKSYASVVLSKSKVAFLEEEKDTNFCPFLLCFVYRLFYCIIGEVCCQILLFSKLQGVFHQGLQLFWF